jgi:hypothetical protein
MKDIEDNMISTISVRSQKGIIRYINTLLLMNWLKSSEKTQLGNAGIIFEQRYQTDADAGMLTYGKNADARLTK